MCLKFLIKKSKNKSKETTTTKQGMRNLSNADGADRSIRSGSDPVEGTGGSDKSSLSREESQLAVGSRENGRKGCGLNSDILPFWEFCRKGERGMGQ